jgi:uncharacterized protein
MSVSENSSPHALRRIRLTQAEERLRAATLLMAKPEFYLDVVNRSYYAAFYAILALIESQKFKIRSHQSAISLFDREFIHSNKLSAEVSAGLHRLFDMRIRDDYRELRTISREQATEAVETAENFECY